MCDVLARYRHETDRRNGRTTKTGWREQLGDLAEETLGGHRSHQAQRPGPYRDQRPGPDDPDRALAGESREVTGTQHEIRFGLPISDPDPGSSQYQKPAETGKGGRGQRRQGKVSGDLPERLPEE